MQQDPPSQMAYSKKPSNFSSIARLRGLARGDLNMAKIFYSPHVVHGFAYFTTSCIVQPAAAGIGNTQHKALHGRAFMLYHVSCFSSYIQRKWGETTWVLLIECSVVVITVTVPWLRLISRYLIHLYVYGCCNTELEATALQLSRCSQHNLNREDRGRGHTNIRVERLHCGPT
jgi:hypothetical protein